MKTPINNLLHAIIETFNATPVSNKSEKCVHIYKIKKPSVSFFKSKADTVDGDGVASITAEKHFFFPNVRDCVKLL